MLRGFLRNVSITVTSLLTAMAAADLRADVVYDDTVSADLSNVYDAPTSIDLPFGTSTVKLRTRQELDGFVDLDIFRINLPTGGGLTHTILSSWDDHTETQIETAFLALQEGPTLTFDPTADPYRCLDECLGQSHFGPGYSFNGMGLNDNLLVGNSDSSGLDDSRSQGFFTTPLLSSHYTFWVQDFDDIVNLSLDFVVAPVYGDYNHDGATNAADYTVWRNSLGATVAKGSGADGNADGAITMADYGIWKTNYGVNLAGSGSGAAVPEPTSVLLLLSGLLAAASARRRYRFSS